MCASNVKFFTYGSFDEAKVFGATGLEKNYESAHKTEAEGLLRKLRTLGLQPDERNRQESNNGIWFCKVDKNNFAYLVLCGGTYPERHAFAMLNDLEQELEKRVKGSNLGPKDFDTIDKDAKKFVTAVLRRYDNIRELDKLYEAQQNADAVQNVMNLNIQQVLQNTQDVEAIRGKSENLRAVAGEFNKDSKRIERTMYWKNMRLKLIISLIILTVILFIAIPLAVKYAGGNNGSDSTNANNSTGMTNSSSNSTDGTLRF